VIGCQEKEELHEFKIGSTRLHSVENSLWKRIWTVVWQNISV